MKTHKTLPALIAATMFIVLMGAAELIPNAQGQVLGQESRPEGWSEETHGNSVKPDYATVFPQDAVNTITITISAENWQVMMDDMTENYGEFGSNTSGGMGGGRPAMGEGQQPPEGGRMPGGNLDFGGGANPVWVPADIEFGDLTWTNVGFRLKGNSSLSSTWGSGSYKLPFKLDFDEFEDDYPGIDNQRFYSFKQLSFSSNWSDDSYLREKVTADIFREMGVPSAQTAFYAVYVDYGEGLIYFGLYTAVEVIDDTVIETQFADDDGNAYKPSGSGATFAEGTFTEEAFDKETNKSEEDYSDILAVFDALHADTRLTDPDGWRAGLESVFDVDVYLRWLAVNTVVQNWDTYGNMSHNYYLYTDPTTGLVTWIPWDNNEALAESRGGGPGGSGDVVALDLENVNNGWPLIRYLADDPVYHEIYVNYVDELVNTVFAPERMTAIYEEYHDLVAPYVAAEQPNATTSSAPENFDATLTQLIEHVNGRYTLAQEYVMSQTQ
jgi:spore coat protein H